jgi:hypothetical protein
MKFEISFNGFDDPNKNNKEVFDFIGAASIDDKELGHLGYHIELESFEDLEKLLNKINMKLFNNTFEYDAIINFDPPCIFLDKDK